MFKVLKIKEAKIKTSRRILFITEIDLERPSGSSVNDRKTINCLKNFGKLKCFYLKRIPKANLIKKYLSALKIFLWIIRKRPHVIFLRSIQFAFALGILRHILRIRLVYLALSVPFKLIEGKFYEGTSAQLSRISQMIIKVIEPFVLLEGTDIIIVSNKATKQELIKYGVNDKKLRIVPFYVEKSFFDIPLRRQGSLYFTMGYIGRFTPLHDLQYLIEVVKKLNDEIKNLKLILVGEGPLFNEIKDEVKKNNLQDYVTFLGRVPHSSIPEIILNFDVFVLPLAKNFISTALPIKVLEAAASARPIVLTRAGGIEKILKHEESCLFVEAGNPNEIAEAVLNLYKSPTSRERLGKVAREQVKKYSKENVCKEYLHILKAITTI